MPITDVEAQLAKKQKHATSADLQECGWLQTQFPESFGSGGVLGPEIGADGHLWIMIPISEDAAATASKGAGIGKPIQEIIPNADPGKWKLHVRFRSYSRGFFKKQIWICNVDLMAARQQIFLGFIVATNLKQFAADLRQMIDIGIPTFESAIDGYRAVP